MRRVILTVIWIFAVAVVASAQTTFYFPHVLNGVSGVYDWKTTIFLTNPASSGTASGTISFTMDNNNPLSAGSSWSITLTDETGATITSNMFSFSLPPGATRKLVSTAPGGLVSGFATVNTIAGTVGGTAIFSEFDDAGKLIAEAGVPSASPVPRQAILVDTVAGYGVGVAYMNPGTGVANITLNLLDNFGTVVAGPVMQVLGPGNHAAAFTSQLFKSAGPLTGTMQITSSSPLAAIALRFDPTLLKFTTLPPVTLASLIGPAIEWPQERAWLTPLTSIARLFRTLQLRMG